MDMPVSIKLECRGTNSCVVQISSTQILLSTVVLYFDGLELHTKVKPHGNISLFAHTSELGREPTTFKKWPNGSTWLLRVPCKTWDNHIHSS